MGLTAAETMISTRTLLPVTTNVDLPAHRGIWIGASGNLAVTLVDGTTVTITGVVAGTLLPLEVKRINSSGTTATGMLLWV